MSDPLEEKRRELTHAIGDCILAWAQVEKQLAVLFFNCMGGGLLISAFYAIDSVVSFDARLAMIGGAIKGQALTKNNSVTAEHAAKWKSLSAKARKKYVKRNEIAHSDIVEYKVTGMQSELVILTFPVITRDVGEETTLRLSDLIDRKTVFGSLSTEIDQFRLEMLRAQMPLPKPDEPRGLRGLS